MRHLQRAIVRRNGTQRCTARPCSRCGEPLSALAAIVGIHTACVEGRVACAASTPMSKKHESPQDQIDVSLLADLDAFESADTPDWGWHLGLWLAPGCRMVGRANMRHADDF